MFGKAHEDWFDKVMKSLEEDGNHYASGVIKIIKDAVDNPMRAEDLLNSLDDLTVDVDALIEDVEASEGRLRESGVDTEGLKAGLVNIEGILEVWTEHVDRVVGKVGSRA